MNMTWNGVRTALETPLERESPLGREKRIGREFHIEKETSLGKGEIQLERMRHRERK